MRYLQGAATAASDVAGIVYDLQVLSVRPKRMRMAQLMRKESNGTTLGAVADWSQVIGLRVQFSVRSEADNTGPESKTYMFNGVSVTDKRLRRDFVTNIGIRNRLP
jgi:hypothetical protein